MPRTEPAGAGRSRGRSLSAPRRTAPAGTSPPSIPGIYDYGLIGDLHTAALVSRFGGIDWACFPQFDSPSVLGRLLDLDHGGTFAIAPVEEHRSQQEYLDATAVLRTSFRLSGHRTLTLLDFMPITRPSEEETAPMVVRIVEASGGPIGVRVMVDPRFDYGRWPARWGPLDHRWAGRSARGTVTVRPGWALSPNGGELEGTAVLGEGGRAVFELYWGVERPTRNPSVELMEQTRRFWTDWVHPPDSPIHLLAGRWHPWIERSGITLKLLSHAETGAFIAAPTTSLPEWPGGRKNWDYRYAWIRDAAFSAQSLALMGHVFEARSFLRWVVNILHRTSRTQQLRVMYGAHGESDLTEHRLTSLAGYLHSRPVRIGNAAALQFQLDIYGELLDAALLLSEIEPDALERSWPLLEELADEVARLWHRPDRGIWELRGRPAHFVYSKVMAWVALDRAVRLGNEYGTRERTGPWERERDRIRSAVVARGFDRKRGTFVQAFENHALDAANLRIPLVGFLPADDPRVVGTVRGIERELSEGPFVYRFRPSRSNGGPEGAFLPCSFWLVDCLARAGERVRATERFEALLAASSPHGLLAEEYDPVRRMPLGNYPQAFSHIAMLRAALSLGLSTIPDSVREQHPGLVRVVRGRLDAGAGPIPLGRPRVP